VDFDGGFFAAPPNAARILKLFLYSTDRRRERIGKNAKIFQSSKMAALVVLKPIRICPKRPSKTRMGKFEYDFSLSELKFILQEGRRKISLLYS